MLTYKSPWQASRPKLQIIFDIPFLLECSEAIVSSITIPDMNSFEWHPNRSFQKCQECFLFKSDRTKKSLFPSSEHRSVLFNPPPWQVPLRCIWFDVWLSTVVELLLIVTDILALALKTSLATKVQLQIQVFYLFFAIQKTIVLKCPHLFYLFNVMSM